MTKKKLSYWDKRSIREEEAVQRGADVVEKNVTNAYLKAQDYLTDEVKKIYKRYLNKTDKSEAEVKQILNTSVEPAELVKLKQLTKSTDNPQLKTESQNYLDGLAVKHRITRLEDLKAKSYLVSKQVANVSLSKQTDFYVDTIHDAYNNAAVESIIGHAESGVRATNNGKYKSWAVQDGKLVHELIDTESGKVLDTVKVTKDVPVTEFKELSTKYVKNILDSHWAGSNYSKRLWGDTELLAKRLEELFTVEAMTGMSELEMSKAIAKEFDQSINVARRLIRTEANYMANQAKLKSWKEHDVEEYVVVATLDLKTSETCRKKDGKRFKVSEAVCDGKDGTFPPFHPWCRTVVRAYFGEHSLQGTRTAIDRVTGEEMTIKQSTTYKEWEKMILDKHSEPKTDKVTDDSIKEQIDSINLDKATHTDLSSLGNKLNKLYKIDEILGEKDKITSILNKFRPMNGKIPAESWYTRSNKMVKSQLEVAFSHYPKDWADIIAESDKKIFAGKTDRGFFSQNLVNAKGSWYLKGARAGDGFSIYSSGMRKTTAYHEIGHMVEHSNPELLRISKEFVEYRTANENPTKLTEIFPGFGYGNNEVTKKDNFISPYIGKAYPNASEVLSVGLESVFEPGIGQLKGINKDGSYNHSKISDDPEFLDLTLGMLLKG